ncbi:MAG TPA: SEC-C metal-binding domain-containing protein, partial [Candidatus Acidoferrum sp.]|nr:SEC-C metal-binding domain-containing protein [Candidatus Acidoferrum sp.]
TERHESRRIDNQLRGRAGRQGDPGYSRFYLSLDDNLMRLFASERVANMMRSLGMEKGEAIEHRIVTNSIEKAQRKVENRNFDIRKQLLEYDDVANEQRKFIYQRRNELMEIDDISPVIKDMRKDVVGNCVDTFMPPGSIDDQWDIPGLEQALHSDFGVKLPVHQWLSENKQMTDVEVKERALAAIEADYDAKCAEIGDNMRIFEKQIMLQVLDTFWKEHLGQMDSLRQGIGLRGYGGKNPKQEYKREAFNLFDQLLKNLQVEVIKFLSLVRIRREEEVDAIEKQRQEEEAKVVSRQIHADPAAAEQEAAPEAPPPPRTPVMRAGPKVGRNEPCPCGSGLKYKACHGKLEA